MPIIRQSGAIVVRLDGTEPQVLLVTAKRNPENWIFPKGLAPQACWSTVSSVQRPGSSTAGAGACQSLVWVGGGARAPEL
jgi:hypothetical protein